MGSPRGLRGEEEEREGTAVTAGQDLGRRGGIGMARPTRAMGRGGRERMGVHTRTPGLTAIPQAADRGEAFFLHD